MFVHLHLHTEYSLVDSVVRIQSEAGDAPGLMDAVVAAGMPAVALTDQGNLFAMVKFFRAAQAAGVKPIIGVDLRVREYGERAEPSKLVLLCQNEVGYRNLTRLVSRSYLEGQQRGIATIDRSWLDADNLVGLIATAISAGRSSTVAKPTRTRRSKAGCRCSAIATTSSCSEPSAKARSATSRAHSIWPRNTACRSSRPTTCASSAPTTTKRTKRAYAFMTAPCSVTPSGGGGTAPSSI